MPGDSPFAMINDYDLRHMTMTMKDRASLCGAEGTNWDPFWVEVASESRYRNQSVYRKSRPLIITPRPNALGEVYVLNSCDKEPFRFLDKYSLAK